MEGKSPLTRLSPSLSDADRWLLHHVFAFASTSVTKPKYANARLSSYVAHAFGSASPTCATFPFSIKFKKRKEVAQSLRAMYRENIAKLAERERQKALEAEEDRRLMEEYRKKLDR